MAELLRHSEVSLEGVPLPIASVVTADEAFRRELARQYSHTPEYNAEHRVILAEKMAAEVARVAYTVGQFYPVPSFIFFGGEIPPSIKDNKLELAEVYDTQKRIMVRAPIVDSPEGRMVDLEHATAVSEEEWASDYSVHALVDRLQVFIPANDKREISRLEENRRVKPLNRVPQAAASK